MISADDLEWYPLEFVDESCPPHKSGPDEFVFAEDGGFVLGYGPDQKKGSADFVGEEEREIYNRKVAVGDVIEFITCDHLPDVDVTFYRDGRHELHGALPADYNWVRVEGDQDTLCDSFDELIEATKVQDSPHGPIALRINPFEIDDAVADDEGRPRVESVRLILEFAKWSNALPHRLILDDLGKPKFVAVSDIN